MKKYYKDPLAAAYMAREYDIRFVPNVRGYSHAVIDLTLRGEDHDIIAWNMVDGDLDGWNNRIGEALKPEEKIYIHPDSYNIFDDMFIEIEEALRVLGMWPEEEK